MGNKHTRVAGGLDAATEIRSRNSMADLKTFRRSTRIWQGVSGFLACFIGLFYFYSTTENILSLSQHHLDTTLPNSVGRRGTSAIEVNFSAPYSHIGTVFGPNFNDAGPCRHYCTRIAMHQRQAAFGHGGIPKENATSFQEFRSLLVDTGLWMCDDMRASMLEAQQHGCDCTNADVHLRRDVPGGLTFGTVQLWEFFRRFAAQQAYMLEWFHNRYDLGQDLRPASPIIQSSPHGCAIETPDQPRIVVFRCSGPGGAADQIKGMLSAFVAALLHPEPHAFVVDCDTTQPLELAFLPHTGNVAIDWRYPTWLKKQFGIIEGSPAGPLPAMDTYEWWDHPGQFKGLAKFYTTGRATIKLVFSNAFFGRLLQRKEIQAMLASRYAQIKSGPCSMPPELWHAALGLFIEPSSTLADFQPMPPFPSVELTSSALHSNDFSLLHAAGCVRRGMGLPGIIATGTGAAAGSANLPVQLLDFLFRPSPRLTKKILSMTHHYHPQEQLVITTHIRVGTPTAGATYTDPARDNVAVATRIALSCSARAFVGATQMVGPRKQLLWYVATDNRDATAKLLAMAETQQIFGMKPTVIELPATVPTIHVGSSAREGDLAPREEGFLIVYAEMFLLSAGHAILRSRSGFSQLAQGWGRIPITYQFKPEHVDVCEDMSMTTFQTTLEIGVRIGATDSSLWELPQVWVDTPNAD